MAICTMCLKGDTNSYSRKYGGKSERRHVCNRKLPTHRIRTWPLVGNSHLQPLIGTLLSELIIGLVLRILYTHHRVLNKLYRVEFTEYAMTPIHKVF